MKRTHTVLLTCVGIAQAVPAGPDRSREHKHRRASEVAAGPMLFPKVPSFTSAATTFPSSFPPCSLLRDVIRDSVKQEHH